LTVSGLQGATSKEIELFIFTAVRPTDLTRTILDDDEANLIRKMRIT
jgi:hypothetical protein